LYFLSHHLGLPNGGFLLPFSRKKDPCYYKIKVKKTQKFEKEYSNEEVARCAVE